MKANVGATLADAIDQWKRLKQEAKTTKAKKVIAPQFKYNTYLRDFLSDNPNANRDVGIALWKIKKSLRGDNIYRKEDLSLLEK